MVGTFQSGLLCKCDVLLCACNVDGQPGVVHSWGVG